jgi:16S rRNA (guanine527-N7)-methyltransferase
MTLNFDFEDFKTYFPELTGEQFEQFLILPKIYIVKNENVNVISRKDIDNIYVRHILHSTAIAKIIRFKKGTSVLDVGTGGGFPGIPLAIMFPEVKFTLIDSVAKKIKIVNEVIDELHLKNVRTKQIKSTMLNGSYNYITGRAVTAFPAFYESVKHLIKLKSGDNALIYLKGGDFEQELSEFPSAKIFKLNTWFKDEFFETKKIIVLQNK